MLSLRSSRFQQIRFPTSSPTSAPKLLTRDDVDIILKPDEKYMNAFMKYHGNHRNVFKKSDISLWQNSFGNDFEFRLMCLKGTTRVISTTLMNVFRPIDKSNIPAYFIGFGWVDSKMRKLGATALLNEMVLQGADEKSNIVSHMNQNARKFWNTLINKKRSEAGDDSLDAGYISLYERNDFLIPDNLSFDGITVKSAMDVPKVDMIRYDQKIHPFHREKYIISHMRDKDGFGKVAYDKDGKVVGMAQAVIYPRGDCNLGPVYADNPRVAQAMFQEILKDIAASGKTVTRFEVRSNQMNRNSFTWIKPFLKCELRREHICNLVYRHTAPKNLNFSKVYCPTHAQLFLV